MNRISITNREECDNSSDPAASSSTGSQENPAATPESSFHQGQNQGEENNVDESNTREDPVDDSTTQRETAETTATSSRPSEVERINELRAILPDASDEELRQIILENDRASNNTQQSAADAVVAAAAAAPPPSSPSSPGSTRRSGSGRSSRGSRRSWQPCRPAPSRPGVFREGGPVETGGSFNIGQTDPIQLEIKRIEAVSQVQDALNDRLGYNLRESGKYEECERLYKEGEQMLASTGLERRTKKVLPTMMVWDAPPVSRNSMMKKEPHLPPPGEPLPLPLSFGGHGDGMQGSGNGEICLGKFVDTAPDEDEDEMKREETTVDNESWAEVSIDDSPLGPYDQVVRCWKCRAGLKVHIEVGLVACPRCRGISPATDIANIG